MGAGARRGRRDGDDFFFHLPPHGEYGGCWEERAGTIRVDAAAREGARWERTLREGGADGVVERLAVLGGALLLRNVLSDFGGMVFGVFGGRKSHLQTQGGCMGEGRGAVPMGAGSGGGVAKCFCISIPSPAVGAYMGRRRGRFEWAQGRGNFICRGRGGCSSGLPGPNIFQMGDKMVSQEVFGRQNSFRGRALGCLGEAGCP